MIIRKGLLSLLIISVLFIFACEQQITQKTVREPAFAGTWYPGTGLELNNTLDGFLDNVNKLEVNGTIKAVIVPHAGYHYSGQIAAAAFKQLSSGYEDVFLLGPSHRYALEGISVLNVTHYKTPLGEVPLSDKAREIRSNEDAVTVPEAHKEEHSLEIELPFLQRRLGEFKLVPMLVGPIDANGLKKTLLGYVSEDDLIVVSVDLSHYHSYEAAKQLDAYSINSILNLDPSAIMKAQIDAPWAVATLLEIAKEKGWKPLLLYYANSGDITGDKESVVGYSAFVFVEEYGFSEDDKDLLLRLARASFESYVKDGKRIAVDEDKLPESLRKVQGCFTTLNEDGSLRGCIGHIIPQEELYKCVIDNAVNAAVNDRRFSPVSVEELEDIEVEVSVLAVPYELEYSSPEELLGKLRPMVDGVVIKSGFHQSTYLPQVWEQLPDKEQFLSELCKKAGLERDCWKDSSAEVYVYQAEVFSE